MNGLSANPDWPPQPGISVHPPTKALAAHGAAKAFPFPSKSQRVKMPERTATLHYSASKGIPLWMLRNGELPFTGYSQSAGGSGRRGTKYG